MKNKANKKVSAAKKRTQFEESEIVTKAIDSLLDKCAKNGVRFTRSFICRIALSWYLEEIGEIPHGSFGESIGNGIAILMPPKNKVKKGTC